MSAGTLMLEPRGRQLGIMATGSDGGAVLLRFSGLHGSIEYRKVAGAGALRADGKYAFAPGQGSEFVEHAGEKATLAALVGSAPESLAFWRDLDLVKGALDGLASPGAKRAAAQLGCAAGCDGMCLPAQAFRAHFNPSLTRAARERIPPALRQVCAYLQIQQRNTKCVADKRAGKAAARVDMLSARDRRLLTQLSEQALKWMVRHSYVPHIKAHAEREAAGDAARGGEC